MTVVQELRSILDEACVAESWGQPFDMDDAVARAIAAVRKSIRPALDPIVAAYHVVEHGQRSLSWKDCDLLSCVEAQNALTDPHDAHVDPVPGCPRCYWPVDFDRGAA